MCLCACCLPFLLFFFFILCRHRRCCFLRSSFAFLLFFSGHSLWYIYGYCFDTSIYKSEINRNNTYRVYFRAMCMYSVHGHTHTLLWTWLNWKSIHILSAHIFTAYISRTYPLLFRFRCYFRFSFFRRGVFPTRFYFFCCFSISGCFILFEFLYVRCYVHTFLFSVSGTHN